jgi:ribonuclease HI
MTLLNPAPIRQLSLQWDAEPRALPHHLAEWTTGSAISPGIAELAIESIKGTHQVLGFLNPAKLGRNLGYATKPVQRARQHYIRPCRGGWLASGHAPLEGGRLVPVTFKPDAPRLGDDGKEIKYERPAGSRPLPFFAQLDAAAYEAIAARAGLKPPPFESSWPAWLWLLEQPAVEVVVDEGEKKSASACSHGWLTIGLAGIWNGAPRPKDASGQPFGAPTLIAELQWLKSIRPAGAPLTIAFDASESARGRIDIRNARRRLGRLLLDAGHQVRIREMVQPNGAAGFIKGTDDLLVQGGVTALAALPVLPFDQWLKAGNQQAISDHLLHPFKTKNRQHRAVDRHFRAGDVPTGAELVALIGGLGSNKTGTVAELAQTQHPLRQVVAAACDGSCKGNPGAGGFGGVVRFADGSSFEIGGHAAETTNNRMELQALIEVLQVLRDLDLPDGLVVETDSKYVKDCFEKWLPNWKRNGWRTSTGDPVKNVDLLQQLDQLRLPGVAVQWVKGHAGHVLNERCDQIASAFAAGETPRLRQTMPTSTASRRLVSITHRRSLADNQGMRFGLAVKREGQVLNAIEQSQADLRQVADLLAEHEGFVTVADSSYIGGSGELRPESCRGAVLFIDEADAFLRHCLTASTHIAERRCEVLTNLAACVAAADQVLLAGAHIDELTLQAFEAMRGCNCTVIESTLQTAAGRDVVMHRTVEQLLQQVRNLASNRQPFIFHTGSKQDGSKLAPVNLARHVRRWWSDARVLELTAETIRDPNHPASAAINDPQLLLGFDVVLASPVLETGFSIEDPAGHFAAVLGHTSGHVMPHAFVQSLGRLRTGVVRHIWCNHSGSRIGNGAPVADEIERTKLDHAGRLALVHMHEAGDLTGDASRFVRWWSAMAADQNWLAGAYRHAVATLLEREGYAVDRRDLAAADASTELVELLTEDRDETVAIETAAVAAAPAPDANQLEQLEKRQRLTAEQRRQIERGRIKRDLGIANPTAAQVAASRNGAYGKLMQHLLVVDPAARQKWRDHTAANLTASQRAFAPDATKAMAPAARATALASMPWLLELLDLVGTGQTVIGFDFEQHHATAKAQSKQWRELFGFDPSSGTVRTFLSQLLALVGFKLQRTSGRQIAGDRVWWKYEVVDDLKALDRREALRHLGSCHFSCK